MYNPVILPNVSKLLKAPKHKEKKRFSVLLQWCARWDSKSRSLNRRQNALERRPGSFRANRLRALAFGTPHWGDASFVCHDLLIRRSLP